MQPGGDAYSGAGHGTATMGTLVGDNFATPSSPASHGHDPKTSTVGEAMNRKVIFCFEEDDCGTALHRMDEHGLKHITVVDQQLRIVGMVRHEDLQAV